MFNLWNLKRKTHECDRYKDKEMTDEEKEDEEKEKEDEEEKLVVIESISIKLRS